MQSSTPHSHAHACGALLKPSFPVAFRLILESRGEIREWLTSPACGDCTAFRNFALFGGYAWAWV